MKRLLVLLLTLSLTSCAYIGATEDILISSPPTEASLSALSGDPTVSSDTPISEGALANDSMMVLNKSSKKVHYFDSCSYAGNIKEENRSTAPYETLASLLENGYSVCSWCEKQANK